MCKCSIPSSYLIPEAVLHLLLLLLLHVCVTNFASNLLCLYLLKWWTDFYVQGLLTTVSMFLIWWDYLQVAPQPLWWWKFELNNPGWKLKIHATLIMILHYLEAKFEYSYFIIFCVMVPRIYTKKFQVILSKNKAMILIFPIQNKIKVWENCRHAFIFA